MTDESISKIAKYVAFLYREAYTWRRGAVNNGRFDFFMAKVEAVKDICTILGCEDKVWSEASKIYDFTNPKEYFYE